MYFLEKFYNKTIKYDIINKLMFNNTKKLPKIEKIILSFSYKTTDLKVLSSSLLALELITNQKGTITKAKKSNILFKIRKGSPIGCKITLRKKQFYSFLFKTLTEILPRLKNFEGFYQKKTSKKNIFSYEIYDTFTFLELENHYYLFNNLSKLSITIVTNSYTKEQLIFILKSLQYPIID